MTKAILMTLAEHHNSETDQCNPRVKRIAYKSGFSERTVEAHLRKLINMDLLQIRHNHREDGSLTSSDYVLMRTPAPPLADLVTPGGATNEPGNPINAEPESVIEPVKEPGSEEKIEPSHAFGSDPKEKLQVIIDGRPKWADILRRDPRWPQGNDLVWIDDFESVFIARRHLDLDAGRELLAEAALCAYEWLQTDKGQRKKANGIKSFWANWIKREGSEDATGVRSGGVAQAQGRDSQSNSREREDRISDFQRQADAARDTRAREKQYAGGNGQAGIPA